ncbi:MAG: TlpA family protein disulfide reductase [Candidatus Eremiobacteraeota bacterium]|nr:TlpA family protein disulfide reductase [Candidatus Eremiobacteraeota bacterium]
MSSPPKNVRQGQQTKTAPPQRRSNVTLIASVIGALAIGIIVVYAVLHENRAVPGAAVATDAAQLPPQLTAGAQAPSFELRSTIGSFSSSTLAGKPYLLEIFATWCPHCQRMTKVLREIRTRVPESRLAMLSVTGSPYAANSTPDNLVSENQQDVDKFDSTYGVTWPILFDPNLSVAKKFGLNGFPTFFVVDRKGKIAYSGSGEVTKDVLLRAIHQAGG